ncbi:MAG: hypothetical protein JOY69_05950 [Candidatus Eremiobacteraeota bacterium]|nr:hypothetical protein [Candidatus Eremiobacteraeota bacterium]
MTNSKDKAPALHPDPDIAPPPPQENPNPKKIPANEGGTADTVHDHGHDERLHKK